MGIGNMRLKAKIVVIQLDDDDLAIREAVFNYSLCQKLGGIPDKVELVSISDKDSQKYSQEIRDRIVEKILNREILLIKY